jgi:hypothetical protein
MINRAIAAHKQSSWASTGLKGADFRLWPLLSSKHAETQTGQGFQKTETCCWRTEKVCWRAENNFRRPTYHCWGPMSGLCEAETHGTKTAEDCHWPESRSPTTDRYSRRAQTHSFRTDFQITFKNNLKNQLSCYQNQ